MTKQEQINQLKRISKALALADKLTRQLCCYDKSYNYLREKTNNTLDLADRITEIEQDSLLLEQRFK